MKQTAYKRPAPVLENPTRFHGFKPRRIKRDIAQLYAELVSARKPLSQGFNFDDQSYDNLLAMILIRDAQLPPFNSMPLIEYVENFHYSGMSTLLSMIEPMVVFMAAVRPPMDELCMRMRRWGAFDDPYAMDNDEQEINRKLWKRTSELLGKDFNPEDMPRRFVSYYLLDAERIDDKVQLTGADIGEIFDNEALRKKHKLDPEDYFSAAMQLLRRTMRDHAMDARDTVRAVSSITLNHGDKPPAIWATREGMLEMTAALAPYRAKFKPVADKNGKPFTLN